MKIQTVNFEPGQLDEIAIHPGIDDRRERDETFLNWFENVFHILLAYQSHQKTARELRMSIRVMANAIGFNLAAGFELGRKRKSPWTQCGVSKQCFNKCLNHFIAQLRLEPLPSQRKAEARQNMSRARKAQL